MDRAGAGEDGGATCARSRGRSFARPHRASGPGRRVEGGIPVEAGRAGRLIRRVAVAREARDGRLVVSGPAGDEDAYRRALIAWLRRRGRNTLVARLEELAPMHGFTFERATVRNQRTRWGSCSPRRTISLNLRLLFLDPVLVDHVLIHELCHTRELNHSRRFWSLMQAHDPDCALHRRQARDAWRSLPSWVDGRRAGPRV